MRRTFEIISKLDNEVEKSEKEREKNGIDSINKSKKTSATSHMKG